MEWVVLALLVAGGGGVVAWWQMGVRRRARRQEAERTEQVEVARTMADEDTTLLGEQLARLGVETP